MLASPRDAVIGASDLDRMTEFLAVFGFQTRAAGTLPQPAARALYGLDMEPEERLLEMPGSARGRVRLVSTPVPARRFAPFDARPFAIDLFSSDIVRSVDLATGAGLHVSPVTAHQFGPVVIRELEVTGPDGLIVTLLERTSSRWPSLLDGEPDRLHSEVHAFVWSAKELDRLLPFWEGCGLGKHTDAVLATPGLGALVGVPEADVKMRLTVFSDPESRQIRVELVDFLGQPAAAHDSLPLAAGLHAPAFEVADLDAAVAALLPARVGEVVELDTPLHPRCRAVTAVAPGELLFEVWESR